MWTNLKPAVDCIVSLDQKYNLNNDWITLGIRSFVYLFVRKDYIVVQYTKIEYICTVF